MNINDKLAFGRYKGLTVREVFCGSKDINRDLLAAYLIWRLNKGDQITRDDEITVDMYNFEIDLNFIKLTPTLSDFKGNASTYLEKFFISGNSIGSKVTNQSLDSFCYDVYMKERSPTLKVGGVPEYIAWCIKTVDKFFINPIQISLLETEVVNRFAGIKVTCKNDNEYEYHPKFINEQYRFSESFVKINNSKMLESN